MIQAITSELPERLNSFDYYYEMSDSSKVWDKWSHEKSRIKRQLKSLSPEQMIDLKESIKVDDSQLFRHFSEFNGLPKTETEKNIRSEVFTTAWALVKTGLVDTIGKALVLAWKRIKVLSSLRKGIAYFAYYKVSGELRYAIGTLRNGNFDYQYKSSRKADRLDLVKYFDLEARAWRSFRLENLVSLAA